MLTRGCVREGARTSFKLQCHDVNAIITPNISFLAYYSSQHQLFKEM
jgi:hypothetical protein